MKKLLLSLLLYTLTITTCGCAEVQIFKTKARPYDQVHVKDSELEDDIYYIKSGTRFTAAYLPEQGSAKNKTNALKESRVFAAMLDDSLIPDFYADELAAYRSDKLNVNSIILERFADLGYSIGGYDGYFSDGCIHFSTKNGLAEGSSLTDAVGKTNAEEVRVANINGRNAEKSMLRNGSGTISGLEKDKKYTIGYYVGTKYYEREIVADCHMYGAMELFSYGEEYIEDTHNGYLSFKMPPDLKDGYYNINGSGLYRYHTFKKGEEDEGASDYNAPYYLDEKSRVEAYSRQYGVQIPRRVKDLKITVKYDAAQGEDDPQGIVFAPDGTRYDMAITENPGEFTISFVEGMAGDWSVNVIPRTLDILDVSVDSSAVSEEATCEETRITLDEETENIQFISYYTAQFEKEIEKCTVYGTILAPDGRTTYQMEPGYTNDSGKRSYYLACEIPYAAAGEYIIRIYHFPEETEVEKPNIVDHTTENTEVIVIEG